MLTIYTNNEYPNLYDGERLLHVLTGNPCDELHVIVDGTMPEDEVEEEIRLALRRKYGRGYGYEGYEELTEPYVRFTTTNANGIEVEECAHLEACAVLMDDEIRERLHAEMAPCTEQEFMDAYCEAHLEKFGERFAI